MDVRNWLEGTADRAPPDPSDVDEARLPALLDTPSNPGPANPARKYRRKRKREASDSSIIVPRPVRQQPRVHDEAAPYGTHVQPLGRSRAAAVKRALRSGSECESRGSSRDGSPAEPESLPKKTYTKRQRHKTKADRYEPKAKKERKERDQHHEHSKTKRRKSRRNGDGEHTRGLLQSFQLKNGPKNSRLTLKQNLNAGLFRHGRASAQLSGKSSGLPDLVFNEMKFLQKLDPHQDDHEAKPSKRKHNKREKRRELEGGEIANYFATQSQRRREGSKHNPQEAITQRRKTFPTRTANKKPSAASPNRQLGDLPEVPYLGFGKQGPLHHSSQPSPQTTSYFSWSESTAHRASQKIDGNLHTPRPQTCQPSKPKSKPEQPLTKHRRTTEGTAHQRIKPNKQEMSQAAGGQWVPSQRTRSPAMVEAYQSQTQKVATEDTRPPSRKSQSLPKAPSRRASTYQPGANPQKSWNRSHPEEYHTSDILKVHDRMHKLAAMSSAARESSVPPSDKEKRPPESSSPTSKLLKRAQTATKRQAVFADRDSTRTPHETQQNEEIDTRVNKVVPRHSANAYTQRWDTDAVAAQHIERLVSERDLHPLHRVSEQFWHPPPVLDPQIRLPPGISGLFDIWKDRGDFQEGKNADEEDLLHNRPSEWDQSNEMSIGCNFGQPNTLPVQGLPLEPQSQQFELGGPMLIHRNARPSLERLLTSRTLSGPGPSVFVDDASAATATGVQELGDKQLEDFWRPNRLY